MLHTDEATTCRFLSPTLISDRHLAGRCEDCDVAMLAAQSLGRVEGWWEVGIVTDDQLAAYRHVWAVLSPHGGGNTSWRNRPADPTVRRIARKLCQAKSFEIPDSVKEE